MHSIFFLVSWVNFLTRIRVLGEPKAVEIGKDSFDSMTFLIMTF